MINKKEEFIICAALHYRDGLKYQEQPRNIESGIVVAGRRHNNCFMTLKQLFPSLNEKIIEHKDFGFITSHDNFVTRAEAFKIAQLQNQIWHEIHKGVKENILTSEDLYIYPNEY